MTTENTITTIKRDLIRAFAVLDGWFDKDDAFHHYKPPGNSTPARNLLEHAMLTSRYLTTVIDNGGSQLSMRAGEEAVCDYDNGDFTPDHALINSYLENTQKSFPVSAAAASLDELRRELRDHLHSCLCHLDLLQNGEGTLYKTTLFDNDDYIVDLYQCIHVMALCLKKYVEQLSAIENEYRTQTA